MTKEQQHKIGSGFGFDSTADEVLADVDLSGKLAIVTGGYSGIGLPTARALAKAGAHVVVPARRPELARQAVDAEVDQLDLADQASVRAFAQRFLDSGRRIDIMINSAGIMAAPETRVGPGWEMQFATNHLGHFTLVNLLRPAFTDDARVVSVSSSGHQAADIRWDDLHFTRGYDRWQAYGQSKTANVLFAVHLDALGVRSFAVHPGRILTELARHVEHGERVAAGWIDEHGNVVDPLFKSPEQGAATQVWAATSPQLADLGGLYLEDCDVAELTDSDTMEAGVRDYAVDPAAAARLWALSEELTR
ncbi:SDR family NAD(P)-dependent oxidoreductase [Actinophytocola sp.]|uniref:SDR family NAD(P)-dependent oxidoreductase n=1 Tax=Actinophytocola sp. TaxID=1872138 RepID=UPI002ED2D6DE